MQRYVIVTRLAVAAVAACLLPCWAQASSIVVGYDGVLTSLTTVRNCPVDASDCASFQQQQEILLPIVGTLTFSFGSNYPFPVNLEPQISSDSFVTSSGRPITFTHAFQFVGENFAPFASRPKAYDFPNLVDSAFLLPNPVTPAQWDQAVGQTLTSIEVWDFAGAFRARSQYDDTGDVRYDRATWSVGNSQDRMYFPSAGNQSVQFTSSVLLQGPLLTSLDLLLGDHYTEDSFLQALLATMACEYCLQLDVSSGVYDTVSINGMSDSNQYSGYARLTGLQVAAVPEPNTFVLALLALGLALGTARPNGLGRSAPASGCLKG